MSHTIERGKAITPTMNITPLIDIVFLLIIFFMLVNNITSEESVEMVLPDVTDSKARELGEVQRIVVNIAPESFTRGGRKESPLEHNGTASYVKIGTGSGSIFELGDLPGITAALTSAHEANPNVEVLLRADGALYYQSVRPIMNAITAAGISTINLVAYMPEE